ncbi:MAG TPA: DUF1080 domain-containing protein [Parapedobacter sp.]|nr:DUF1080 domain-containing protein [Parapedobacter sp.]
MMKNLLVFMLLLPCLEVAAQQRQVHDLFNGKDFTGWNKFLRTQGLNHDPERVFTIRDGVIKATGKEFGYIATEKTYENFHLSLEFKWGEMKHPPRENEKRDAGILFFTDASDKIWPRSLECQIQEGDVGDLWLIDSATAVVNGVRTTPNNYTRVEKKSDNELPHGSWNHVEVIADGGKFTFKVNGVVVNEGESPSIRDGRIVLQSEGAEVYYRNIKISEQ